MVNQDVEFQLLRKKINTASTQEDKISILEQLVSLNPRGTDALKARSRYKDELAGLKKKQSSASRGGPAGLYDEIQYGRQMVIVGETNTGKSTLLQKLTDNHPTISNQPYTTYKPEIGMYICKDVPLQVVEVPPIYLGEKDNAKSVFIRNSDIICVTAYDRTTADSAISQLEEYLVILTGISIPSQTHKYKPKTEIIEKPGFVACWTEIEGLTIPSVDISDTVAIESIVYNLLGIQRIYCCRKGQLDRTPTVFPSTEEVTVGDFALSLDKRNKGRFTGAKIFGDSALFDGQKVGLSYVLHDGDKVELV